MRSGLMGAAIVIGSYVSSPGARHKDDSRRTRRSGPYRTLCGAWVWSGDVSERRGLTPWASLPCTSGGAARSRLPGIEPQKSEKGLLPLFPKGKKRWEGSFRRSNLLICLIDHKIYLVPAA